MEILEKLKSAVTGDFKLNEVMAPYTSFNIGGPATYFYIASDYHEVLNLINIAKKNSLSYLILGSGSNLLVSDKGYNGLVIKINDNKIKLIDHQIKSGAGAMLQDVVNFAYDNSLSGLEWACGIPGTIGGALVNNAGAFGGEMKDIVQSVDIIRDGKIKTVSNKDCNFIYRNSIFKEDGNTDYVISILMNLKSGNKQEMKDIMDDILSKRNAKEDGNPSAGSVFKNPKLTDEEMSEFVSKYPDLPENFIKYKTIPAAWLIDKCGLKGRSVGGAKISDVHSGRIVNTGTATAENVIMLISVIKQKVRTQFSIQLMEEIQYIGL